MVTHAAAVLALLTALLLFTLASASSASSPHYTADDAMLSALLSGPGAPSLAEFFASYFEQRELVIARGNASFYRSLFGLDRYEGILQATPSLSYGSDVKVVRRGEAVLTAERDGPVSSKAVAGAYADGATVAINMLHERVPAVRELAAAAERSFWSFANVNGYLTPPGAMGLPPHFDVRDVFVLQIEGSKIWSLWDSQDALPIDKALIRDEATRLAPARSRQVTLHAGDLMYMPRGVIHQPRTPPSALSLHLTLGVDPVRWEDVILKAAAPILAGTGFAEPLLRSAPEMTWSTLFTSLLHSLALDRLALRRGFPLGLVCGLDRDPPGQARALADLEATFLVERAAAVEFMRPLRLADMADSLGWGRLPRGLPALEAKYQALVAAVAAHAELGPAVAALRTAVVAAQTVPASSPLFAAIACAAMPECAASATVVRTESLFARTEDGLLMAGGGEAVVVPRGLCERMVSELAAAGPGARRPAAGATDKAIECLRLLARVGFIALEPAAAADREL